MNAWLLVVVSVAFNSAGTLCLKLVGASPARVQLAGISFSPWLIAALGCYGINFAFFAKVLTRLQISIAYPVVVGFSFIAITLGGALLFGEPLTPRHALGWLAILAGVTVLAGL